MKSAICRRNGVLCLALLAGLEMGGCTEQQLAKIDKAVADVNTVAEGVAAIPDGPAGALIPPQVRVILELLGFSGALAIAVWQRVRASGLLAKNADLVTTIRAVVDGIDASGPAADPVKASIKTTMEKRRVYDVADATVDANRSVKTTV